MLSRFTVVCLLLACSNLFAYPASRVELGHLQTGASVRFVRSADGWGIEIIGGELPAISQSHPARVEIFRTEADVRQLATAYKTIQKSSAGVDARGEVNYDRVVFRFIDHWSVKGSVLSLRRKVEVIGNSPGGFDSAMSFQLSPSVGWSDINYMAPGALYGDPTYNGDRSPGGTLNYAAHHFYMREDILPAPLFALSFQNRTSVTILDPSPRGDSTVEETKLTEPVMTDGRFQFGALGAWQKDNGPVEFGFWFPGTINGAYMGGPSDAKEKTVRRYHPIVAGVTHTYEVSFRFGKDESFRETTRNSWRWAWETLKPPVYYIGVEQMRRVLIDHLESQAATIDGRTAIPFVMSTVTDKLQWNWTMAAMGFVGKNIECADQLLREGDRDHTERGQKMRQTGLAVIASMINALPTAPLQATGYDLATGKPWDHIWLAPWLRNATEDMRVLMRAYRRERALGREHPEWFNWVKSYLVWLVPQQREDGSFPRRWKPGSRGTNGNHQLRSRALARHDERRDRRAKVPAIRNSRRRIHLVKLGEPTGSMSEEPATIPTLPTKKPACSAWRPS